MATGRVRAGLGRNSPAPAPLRVTGVGEATGGGAAVRQQEASVWRQAEAERDSGGTATSGDRPETAVARRRVETDRDERRWSGDSGSVATKGGDAATNRGRAETLAVRRQAEVEVVAAPR
uniref:Uncharacterized protein n=1 Tax=Oryza sativa subsp. japonica TaxID=39947 RepID=Q6ESL0_ORYSJ|nr:hypothetical protein [Oryza sativa Japonica Group]